MIITEIDNGRGVNDGVTTTANKQGISVAGVPLHDKQAPAAVKKAALRDVQNQNTRLARGQSENFSFIGGGQNKDAAIKVCGNKRLTPEPPLGPPFFPSISNTCANELIMNARRRFELELGGGRIQNNAKHVDSSRSRHFNSSQQESPQKHIQPRVDINYSQPTGVSSNIIQPPAKPYGGPTGVSSNIIQPPAKPYGGPTGGPTGVSSNIIQPPAKPYGGPTGVSSNIIQPPAKPYGGPSAPNLPVKYGSGVQAAQTDSVKVTTDCPNSNAFEGTDDKQRVERIIRLEKFLKDCGETNSRDYFTMLRHLPPSELSRHAVELEKRAIHLTIEEGKEMQRMKVLNVLEKPFCSNNPSQTLQLVQARK